MYPYVPYVTRMSLVCYPYVLVWCFSRDRRLTGALIEPTRGPAVAFSLRVVCPCGRAMSGVVKVIVSFFPGR